MGRLLPFVVSVLCLLQTQLKQVKDQLGQVQKELQDEKGEHQMTRLRSEKQEEWDRRELAQLKDELSEKKKLMDNMISKDIYKRDLDSAKGQHQNSLADITREKEAERAALEAAKKKLEEDLVKVISFDLVPIAVVWGLMLEVLLGDAVSGLMAPSVELHCKSHFDVCVNRRRMT